MNRVLNDLPDTFYDSITHWMNEGLNELWTNIQSFGIAHFILQFFLSRDSWLCLTVLKHFWHIFTLIVNLVITCLLPFHVFGMSYGVTFSSDDFSSNTGCSTVTLSSPVFFSNRSSDWVSSLAISSSRYQVLLTYLPSATSLKKSARLSVNFLASIWIPSFPTCITSVGETSYISFHTSVSTSQSLPLSSSFQFEYRLKGIVGIVR